MYRRGWVAGAPVPPSARSFRSVTSQLGLKRFRIASWGKGSALGLFHTGSSFSAEWPYVKDRHSGTFLVDIWLGAGSGR